MYARTHTPTTPGTRVQLSQRTQHTATGRLWGVGPSLTRGMRATGEGTHSCPQGPRGGSRFEQGPLWREPSRDGEEPWRRCTLEGRSGSEGVAKASFPFMLLTFRGTRSAPAALYSFYNCAVQCERPVPAMKRWY